MDQSPAPTTRRPLSRRGFLGASVGTGAAAAIGAIGFPAAADAATSSTLQVFANNVGYEPLGAKRVVIGDVAGKGSLAFNVVDTTTRETIYRGTARFAGAVGDWAADALPAVPAVYWVGDFTGLERQGQYVVVVKGVQSAPFQILRDVYERLTMSHVLHYFKGSRSSGQFDKVDAHLPVGAVDSNQHVDVHGGWYDASGDFGIHFGQVFKGPSAPFLVTTQVPLTAWVLGATYRQIVARKNHEFSQLRNWVQDEALFGADFLVRVKDPTRSFYSSIGQDEEDVLDQPEDWNARTLSASKQPDGSYLPTIVSFRVGGGCAIGALAVASTMDVTGDYSRATYLTTAESAYAYLTAHNVELNGGTPDNILDDSEILIAATELWRATKRAGYLTTARARAKRLAARLISTGGHQDYWRADEASRPFFHPSNAGLPVVALLNYAQYAGKQERAALVDAARRSLAFELATTAEVANPFGLARQYVEDYTGKRYTSFFFPHNVSPSSQEGGWWQGENARLGSLAAAARLTASFLKSTDKAFARKLQAYAADQLGWICGLNPYAACMLDGSGQNNPQYYDALGTYQFLPHAGGIVNGITGKADDGSGILYEPNYRWFDYEPDWPSDWRRLEQWLPHSTWFLLATAAGSQA